jgi:hypothetical protein
MTHSEATLKKRIFLSLLLAVPFLAFARSARAEDGPASLSLSIERAAGVSFTSIKPSGSSGTWGLTTVGIGGPAISPIALPRVGADVLLPMGLTLGGALGYGNTSFSYSPDNGQSQSLSANAWLLTPRIGYLIHAGPIFDVWPRAGVTFTGASLKEPDTQSCFSNGTTTTCSTTTGTTASAFLVAASVEVAAALRVTKSFNLLGGISYDHVVSASASTSQTQGGTSTSTSVDASGQYFGPQIWLGLGGYLL